MRARIFESQKKMMIYISVHFKLKVYKINRGDMAGVTDGNLRGQAILWKVPNIFPSTHDMVIAECLLLDNTAPLGAPGTESRHTKNKAVKNPENWKHNSMKYLMFAKLTERKPFH
jgi:hypothetical protein